MIFHTFLLKYGEIGIKGKNRYLFEDALVRQVRFALRETDGEFTVYKKQARIYVDCDGAYDYEEVTEKLRKVFGLVGICPVVRLEDKGFEELKKEVVSYMDEMYEDKKYYIQSGVQAFKKDVSEKFHGDQPGSWGSDSGSIPGDPCGRPSSGCDSSY